MLIVKVNSADIILSTLKMYPKICLNVILSKAVFQIVKHRHNLKKSLNFSFY